MQKIALLSYHFWYNYGTCFQSYALSKVLDDMGVYSEYLNFGWKYPIPLRLYLDNYWNYNIPRYKVWDIISSYYNRYKAALRNRRLFCQMFIDYAYYSNHKKFDEFYKEFIRESRCISEDELLTIEVEYSKFIVGSDQVWNNDCCETKYFKHFLLDFVKDKNKKYSYASSIGKTEVDDESLSLYKEYLSSFVDISCREKTGCEILARTLNRKIVQVLDPTLLLTYKDWIKIAKYKDGCRDSVVCYLLGNKECVIKFALKKAKELNKRLIILSSVPYILSKYREYIVTGIGPCEFLGVIDECSCIITDSFHGTVFAINFNKPFYSFMKRKGGYENSDNSRILDVLNFFGFENCFRDDDSVNLSQDINFANANEILAKERINAYNYLRSIIS